VNLALAARAPAAPRIRDAAGAITRRHLEIALGVIWVLDGALQFQPYMFSNAFFSDMLGMANMGLPGPVSSGIYQVTRLLTMHPVIWNAVFASLQVTIGIGLMCGRSAALARCVSIVWALGVWVVGEGVGALFMPGTSALNGAPGAALLYAVVAVVLWPRRPDDGSAPAGAGVLGATGALWCWAVLWTGLSLLELSAANHAAVVPAAEVANIGHGEPGWLAVINQDAGHLLAGRGAAFALAAGLVQLATGLGAMRPRWRRVALGMGIALAITYGVLGQDLGGLLTGRATDPGTAPLLVLFALALWPRRQLTGTNHTLTGRPST